MQNFPSTISQRGLERDFLISDLGVEILNLLQNIVKRASSGLLEVLFLFIFG